MDEHDDKGDESVPYPMPTPKPDEGDATRAGRRVHQLWESPPSLLWLPITRGLLDVLVGLLPGTNPPRRLTGIQMRLLLFFACGWRFHMKASRFRIGTVQVARALGVSRSCVYQNLKIIAQHGLLGVGHASINFQLWIDIEPLRRAVSGTTTPLAGSPQGVGPFKLWGHTKDRPTWFAGIPRSLITLMATDAPVDENGACPLKDRPELEITRPHTWIVLLLIAVKFARCGRKEFVFDVRKAEGFAGVPERSVRRGLQSIAAAGWIRKATPRPRGRWVIDVSRLVELVADMEKPQIRDDGKPTE